jgi:hypothetical protein
MSVLTIALINAAVLVGIAVLFLVIHLRGGVKPSCEASSKNKNKVLMITLTIGFLVSALIGALISMTQSG